MEQITKHIQSTLQEKGAPYSKYRCKQVSWDDVSRFGAGTSKLSCVGNNITDTRLKAKDGTLLFTVRPDNWNERIGMVSSDDISLIHDNRPMTLTEYLSDFSKNANYILSDTVEHRSLYDSNVDQQVSVRFQTTFLPLKSGVDHIEVAPEVYSYGNKNVNLLCTSQKVSVTRNNGIGKTMLYHHEPPNSAYWFEILRSNHAVGGPQKESEEEAKKALLMGKSMATAIGIKAMNTRFNVLMTVQVPTQQPQTRSKSILYANLCSYGSSGGEKWYSNSVDLSPLCGGSDDDDNNTLCLESTSLTRGLTRCGAPKKGKSNAGRVSRGSYQGAFDKLKLTDIKRDTNNHITVTILLYNVVSDGVPSEEDIVRAIDDMESLYRSCNWNGVLKDAPAKFMNSTPVGPTVIPKIQSFNPILTSFPGVGVGIEAATDY